MLFLWPAVWPRISSDLDPVLPGASSLWRGTDPYADSWDWISPGWPWPLTYPPAALIAGLPLAPLPLLLRPFGWMLLLALLRWRDPAAHLLLALAAVPQAASFADSVLLLLVARTWGEAALMAGTSVAGYAVWLASDAPRGTCEVIVVHGWPFVPVWGYLPVLCVVLGRGWEARSALRV